MSEFILKSRYLYENEKNFDDISKRVAKYISTNDEEYKNFYNIMKSKKFVPGGRTIAYSGTDKKLVPNCVVLPVEDSLETIFETLKRAAVLQQAGCVIEGTKVLTDKGNVLIEEHVGEILPVWNGEEFTPAFFRITGRNKHINKVSFSNGSFLYCTDEHNFLLQNGERQMTENCLPGDRLKSYHLPIPNGRKIMVFPYTYGYFSAKGITIDSHNYIMLHSIESSVIKKLSYDALLENEEKHEIMLSVSNEFKTDFVPDETYDNNFIRFWFSGVFDAIGYQNLDETILESSNSDFIQKIQKMLLYCLDISSYIAYDIKDSHLILHIENKTGINLSIRDIEDFGMADTVYCVTTIDDSHRAVFNGILTGNCGLGFDFSELRPAGFECKRTGGKSSGPISFMALYSHAFKIIQQYNRSGANMGILSIDHPDILSFIHLKDDLSVMNNFNISILLTEEFMENVINNPKKEWRVKWNSTEMTPRIIQYDKDLLVKNITEKNMTYEEVFNDIVKSAWSTGEPGVLFKSNINKVNDLRNYLGDIHATNPCVISGTKILTDKGYVIIDEHIGEVLLIWNGNKFTPAEFKITGKNKHVNKVMLSNGMSITCTDNHNFILNSGLKKELRFCKIGDILLEKEYPVIDGNKEIDNAYYYGFFTRSKYNERSIILEKDRMELIGERLDKFNKLFEDKYKVIIEVPVNFHESLFSPVKNYSIKTKLEWIFGFIDSIGIINEDKFLIKMEYYIETLREIQIILTTMGIKSIINNNELSISFQYINILRLLGKKYNSINSVLLENIVSKEIFQDLTITSIIDAGIAETVYCVTTLDNSHRAVFNGILTGNCSEIMLYSNECCNLGSINLEEFCEINPFYESSYEDTIKYINFEGLKKTSQIAIQFMNNVIEKLDIPDSILNNFVRIMRRLGLGIMGLADMLIKLKVPYNTINARKITEEILKTIHNFAYEESGNLIMKYKSVSERLMLYEHVMNKDLLEKDFNLKNRTNCALTCIAPTGSTSMIHNVSSGIEPYFSIAYRRTFGGKLSDDIVLNKHLKQYLEDNGLYNEEILNKIIEKGLRNIEEIPDYVKNVFITAQEMKARDHILMQSSAQKYIDNSISKTCNFPSNATTDDVKTVFISAYMQGCKGTTVYRDKCRSNQVFVNSCKDGICDA